MHKTKQDSSDTEDDKGMKTPSSSDNRHHAVENTRFLILPASIVVILIGGILFILAGATALKLIWNTFMLMLQGELMTVDLVVDFLEIMSDVLKAVIFFVIGIGLYSMFISPLKLSGSLGVTTFEHLEDRLIGMIAVIMSIEFLERFIRWSNPLEMLQFGGALGLVIISLALFLRFRNSTNQH